MGTKKVTLTAAYKGMGKGFDDMRAKVAKLEEENAALTKALQSVTAAVRQSPDQVIGFDHGGQRQKDFEKGWNAANERVWARLESIRDMIAESEHEDETA